LDEFREKYGDFYRAGQNVKLDRLRIPEDFWPIIHYAEFWGVADDLAREQLVQSAPAVVQQNLREVIVAFDSALDTWLAGPEADQLRPSPEYIAFSALRMAAFFVC
jgi:hypothetical protein